MAIKTGTCLKMLASIIRAIIRFKAAGAVLRLPGRGHGYIPPAR
uniref:Uncharacterized protein n=1 Tax=Anguilla anguilla TaxID=7936 RepID=A0A0E9U4N4_ANGAN